MKPVIFAALAAFLAPTAALADVAYDTCVNKSDGTNVAYATCGAAYVKREDDRLNAAWKALFAKASGQTKTDLLAEQRLWVKYKESACTFYGNGDWGTEGRALSLPACQADVLAQRTRTLKSYLQAMEPQ